MRMPDRTPVAAIAALFLMALPASAGPPFLTDDPEPVEFGRGEIYLFSTLDRTPDGSAGVGPAVEFNWGLARDLQLHLVVPAAYASPSRGARAAGFGDVQLGFKFRVLEETGQAPQIGLFPSVSIPAGDAARGLGSGGTLVELPVWGQKSFGAWTTYGGGGYAVNKGPGGRDYFFGGWLLQRQLDERWMLGGEVYSSGRSGHDSPGSTILNAGGQLTLPRGFSLLFSVGRSVAGAGHTVAYLGLYFTWGGARGSTASALEKGAGPGRSGPLWAGRVVK